MEFEAPNEPMEIHVQSQSINISIIDCGRRKTARKSFQNHQHPKVHAIFTMWFLLFEPFFSGEGFPPGRSAAEPTRPITVRSTCNYYPSNLCVLDLAIFLILPSEHQPWQWQIHQLQVGNVNLQGLFQPATVDYRRAYSLISRSYPRIISMKPQ